MKTATVLKDISPELKKGDILVKKDDYYVKKGADKATVEHSNPNNPEGVLKCRNWETDELVENMPSWYRIGEL